MAANNHSIDELVAVVSLTDGHKGEEGTARTPKNPFFNNVERASYELGYLLKSLPTGFSPWEPASVEHLLMAEAAAKHAENANEVVMRGLAAIGTVLSAAAGNEDMGFSRDTARDIGDLVRHLAVEGQFLQQTRHNLRFTVREQLKRFKAESLGPAG